ncbi:metallophosphoesterase family protein [Gottschalkia acidurici]|nr:DNA repair exonuclease [Gottschalkia acidurici]
MQKIKVIHTGDIHLGLEFKNTNFDPNFSRQRRLEIWNTFEKILDRCDEKEIDLLLIAGDLFEEDYFTIGDIKRIESRFRTLKMTKVVIVTGNHDPINKGSLYNLVEWPNNVYIIKENSYTKIELEDINITVWGLSWDKKEEKRNLLEDIHIDNTENINILLAHGDIYNKNSNYMPIDLYNIKKVKFNYVALGHIHKHEFIDDKIAYCGSPEALDFGETGSHGIIEGEISTRETRMTFVPFSERQFVQKEITLNENMNYQDIINSIVYSESEEERFKNLYKLNISGVIDKDLSINEDVINEIKSMFTHIEIIDNTVPDYDIETIYKENENNIIGYFIREMKGKDLENKVIRRALYLGLESLLSEKVKL